jgi:hypothetical protein
MKKIILFFLLISATVSSIAQSDPAPMPPLEDFIGKYVFPEGSVVPEVDVTIVSDVLNMSSVAGASTCTRLGADSFQIDQFSGWAVFKRGEDKKVNGVHIEAGGYILDGQKQSGGAWAFTYSYRPVSRELLPVKK